MVRPSLLWSLPAALVVVGSLGANHGSAAGEYAVAAGLALVSAAAVVLAWSRPRAAVLLGGVAVGCYFALGLSNGPIYLAVPLALLAGAQRARPRELLPVAVPAVLLVVVGLVVRAAVHGTPWREATWEAVTTSALCAGAAIGGWWLVDRGRMRRERAERAADEERLRMAQDLHDSVGHGLAVIAMQAGVALHVLERDPAAARAGLEAIRDTSRESLEALRSELARMSGGPAPRRAAPDLDDLDALLDRVRSGGLAVELHRLGDGGEVGDAGDGGDAGRAAYAVVQESLTNVLRHARATRATITLERTAERLVVTVADDGTVAAAAVGEHDGGMGIAGMRHRVEALGGSLEAGPGEVGFRVRAEIPLGAPEAGRP